MNRDFISRLPRKITRDTFYRLDEYKIIDEKEVNSIINKEVDDYFIKEEKLYKEETIDKMTSSLKHDFIISKLKDFFDKSYLVKLKKGMDIDNAIKKSDEDLETLCEAYREEFTVLNKIIRKITKDRPNDFEDVIKKIQDKISKNTLVEEEIEEKDIDEELVDLIDEESKKPDKLTKYINTTYKSLYNSCYEALIIEYKEYYTKYIDSHISQISEKVSTYMDKFRKDNMNDILSNKKKNIVNLFDYLLEYYYEYIQWIDTGKHIILVNKFNMLNEEKFRFFSGTICPRIEDIRKKTFVELKTSGTKLTLVVEDEDL